jgi:hypothetical protein
MWGSGKSWDDYHTIAPRINLQMSPQTSRWALHSQTQWDIIRGIITTHVKIVFNYKLVVEAIYLVVLSCFALHMVVASPEMDKPRPMPEQ